MKNLGVIEKELSRIKTDKNRNGWPDITMHSAPHKPFLLLSVMDHVAQGSISTNYIEPSIDLVDTFNTYWSRIMPMQLRTGSMAYPFSRLANDGLWELIPIQGETIHIDSITSMRALRNVCAAARFRNDVFQFLLLNDARERLRALLIRQFFEESTQPKVAGCGIVNQKSYEYSRSILVAEKPPVYGQSEEKQVRDQGFRKAIVTIYEHRCAICGIRIRSEEGHTIVDAAHIKPWSISHDDSATNGMSLCKLCHWTYDEGMMSVDFDYTVKVSDKIQTETNLLGHILTLTGREIFKPDDKRLWPNPENLEWHINERFRKAI